MTDLGRIERNAAQWRGTDPQLEKYADAMDNGDTAVWKALPLFLLDMASGYRDARTAHRRAVAAGTRTEDGTSLLG